ncbi:MAG: O-antigen ligase family protein [Rhodospirillaceae bacterium]|nr:O-antigen ligase family protein [Rhodospirillales bacterium]
MITQTTRRPLFSAGQAACVLLGAGVPAMAFSRGMMQTVLAFALVLAFADSWRMARDNLRTLSRDTVARAIAVLMLCLLPSVALSLHPLTSLGIYLRVALFMAGGYVFWTHLTADPARLQLTLKSLMVAACVSFVVVDLGLTVLPEILAWVRGKSALSMGAVRELKPYASSLMCQIPIILAVGFYLGGRMKAIALGLTVNGIIVLFALRSDSAVVGLLLAVGAVTVLLWWKSPRLILVMGGLLIVPAAAIGYRMIFRDFTYVSDGYQPWFSLQVIDFHRQAIWDFVFHKFLESPWVGYGLNMISQVPGAGDHVPGINAEFVPSHPHNWLLEVASESGLIGTLPWLAVLAIIVLRYGRRFINGRRVGALAVVALTVAFWSSALFNFSIWAPWWGLTFVALFAIAAAMESRPNP